MKKLIYLLLISLTTFTGFTFAKELPPCPIELDDAIIEKEFPSLKPNIIRRFLNSKTSIPALIMAFSRTDQKNVNDLSALDPLFKIRQLTFQIDPDSYSSDWGASYFADLCVLGIYGERIWQLYHDVCGEDIMKMLALLKSKELGLIEKKVIYHAILNEGACIKDNWDTIVANLKAKAPSFNIDFKEPKKPDSEYHHDEL